MAWGAVVLVTLMALPARCAASIIAARDSSVGFLTDCAKLSSIKPIALAAKRFDSSVALTHQYDSIACDKASIPDEAARRRGILITNSGSMIAADGSINLCATEYFSSPTYTTAKCVASLPVPAVVGTARSALPGLLMLFLPRI